MATNGIYLVPRDVLALATARRLTYRQLAALVGCSQSFLCELERGTAVHVTADLAARIEDALDCPRGTLFRLRPADAVLLAPYVREQERAAS